MQQQKGSQAASWGLQDARQGILPPIQPDRQSAIGCYTDQRPIGLYTENRPISVDRSIKTAPGNIGTDKLSIQLKGLSFAFGLPINTRFLTCDTHSSTTVAVREAPHTVCTHVVRGTCRGMCMCVQHMFQNVCRKPASYVVLQQLNRGRQPLNSQSGLVPS